MNERRQYWLLKSEPEAFSIGDLARAPKQTTSWDGVRNYQARNFLRAMKVGDQVLFYHSNANPPSVVGIAEVIKGAYPDATQFDRRDIHYDPGSDPDQPRWDVVDIRFVRQFTAPLPLDLFASTGESERNGVAAKGFALVSPAGTRRGVGRDSSAR